MAATVASPGITILYIASKGLGQRCHSIQVGSKQSLGGTPTSCHTEILSAPQITASIPRGLQTRQGSWHPKSPHHDKRCHSISNVHVMASSVDAAECSTATVEKKHESFAPYSIIDTAVSSASHPAPEELCCEDLRHLLAARMHSHQEESSTRAGPPGAEDFFVPLLTADDVRMVTPLPAHTPSPLIAPEELMYRNWMASYLSAAVQSSPPPRQKQESEEKSNYYVNVGYAIRTLREELPSMFYRELTFDIYRDDITFCDPLNTFAGMDNYKLIFWALRFHGRIFFRALWVDVQRIWQPNDKTIMVRWAVRGLPRVPWEAQGHFDGTSEYKLDKAGKIYEHKVYNVVMNNHKRQMAMVDPLEMLRVAGAGRAGGTTSTPTPNFFRRALVHCGLLSSYLSVFTWVRFYWALASTLALNATIALTGC
eukprot:jgi/Mesen1/10402/ME000081S09795